MNLSAVYHIYPKTYWQEHVCNKFLRMQESGLFEAGVKLYITIIQPTSEDMNWLKESCNEFSDDIKIFPSEENFVEYEAIKLVKELGDSIDGYTMYFHTKGCSRNAHRDQRIIDWDEMMSYFIIDNWKKCVEKLNQYTCVGCNFSGTGARHFSGNFWWANNNYIKQLPEPIKDPFRWAYEFWIGNSQYLNPFCPYKAPLNHYVDRCTPDMYVNADWIKNCL